YPPACAWRTRRNPCNRDTLADFRVHSPSLTPRESVTKHRRPSAQMAELVDALVSGTSAARRGGSSPLLGTIFLKFQSWRACGSGHRSQRGRMWHVVSDWIMLAKSERRRVDGSRA